MRASEAVLRPLAPLEEAHLADGHLPDLLRSLLLPLCTAQFVTLLTVASGVLALAVQDPLDLEAVALVAPAGASVPRVVASLPHPAAQPNSSIYPGVSDLEELELAHRFGVVVLPHVLLAATTAPRGLPSLLRHILGKVVSPRGGVALLGAIHQSSAPLHPFLSAVAPEFFDARRLRQLVVDGGDGMRVAAVRRRVLWLRGATPEELQRSLATLACLARSLDSSAAPCVAGLAGGARPAPIPAALGPAMHAAMAYAQPMYHGGGLGLPLEIEYLVVVKHGRGADGPAVGGGLVAGKAGPASLSQNGDLRESK